MTKDEYILGLFKLLPSDFKKALIYLYLNDRNFRIIMGVAYADEREKKLN